MGNLFVHVILMTGLLASGLASALPVDPMDFDLMPRNEPELLCEVYLTQTTADRVVYPRANDPTALLKEAAKYSHFPLDLQFLRAAVTFDPALQPKIGTVLTWAESIVKNYLSPKDVALPKPDRSHLTLPYFAIPQVREVLHAFGSGYPELTRVRENHLRNIADALNGATVEDLFDCFALFGDRPWYGEAMLGAHKIAPIQTFRDFTRIIDHPDDAFEDLVAKRGYNVLFQAVKNRRSILRDPSRPRPSDLEIAVAAADRDWQIDAAARAGVDPKQIVKPQGLRPLDFTGIWVKSIGGNATTSGHGRGLGHLPGSVGEKLVRELPPGLSENELSESLRLDLLNLPQLAREVILDLPSAMKPAAEARSAWQNLHAVFRSAGNSLLEREQLLDNLEMTFLIDGSILILGPAGVAKSQAAHLLGKHMVDGVTQETSYFRKALTVETSSSETLGGPVVAEQLKGRNVRNWEEGVLGAKVVFLDEFFDGRMKFLRTFLEAFNERQMSQGRDIIPGQTRVFIAATNKYLNEVYEAAGDRQPQALLDRFNTIYFTPGEFEHTESLLGLPGVGQVQHPNFTFQELDTLQNEIGKLSLTRQQLMRTHFLYYRMAEKVRAEEARSLRDYRAALAQNKRVQPPYRSTRVYSPRSFVLAFSRIAVQAFRRGMKDGAETITVTDADVDEALRGYLPMQGPSGDFLEYLLSVPDMDPYEASQYQTLKFEQAAFTECLLELREEERLAMEKARAVAVGIDLAATEEERARARRTASLYATELIESFRGIHFAANIGAKQVAAIAALRFLAERPALKALTVTE